MKPKIYFSFVLIGLISIFLVLFQFSCKKNNEESTTFSAKEQSIITTAETFLISDFAENLKSEMISHREEPSYTAYLDSLNANGEKLKIAIEKITTLSDFKTKLSKFYNDFINLNADSLKSGNDNNSIDCILLKAGLGYGKGSAIEVGASGSWVDLFGLAISAQGGGSMETVYDFVTMEKKVFISKVCAVGGQFGVGLEGGLAGNVGFTGYNDWIFNFKTYGDKINSMEGASRGAQIGIFGDIKIGLGLTPEVSFGTWSDVISECGSLENLLDCPQSIISAPLDDGLHGITFALTGSGSIGPEVGLVAGVSGELTGSCSYGINESYTNFDSNRKLASWKMTMDILNPMPFPGIITMPSGFDIIAACAALTYGNSNLTDCNSIVPQQGLVAYYPFNGNANDEGGNGYNGSVHGATLTEDRFGKSNRAYNFANSINYIQINNFPVLNSVFSYCAWIKPSPASSNGQNFGCYGTIGGGVSSWDVGYYINNQLSVFDRKNVVFTEIVELANTWHFVTIVYNGNISSIYVDGQFKKSQNVITPFPTSSSDVFRIGMHTDSDGNQQFIGNIDDIRTYNRALSENEIQQLYNEGGWIK